MSGPDLSLARVFIRRHPAESAAAVLTVLLSAVLSVTTVMSTVALNDGTSRALALPGYLEITAAPFRNADTGDAAAVPVEEKEPEPVTFEADAIREALLSCPSLSDGWQSQDTVLYASDNPESGFTGGGFPMKGGAMGRAPGLVSGSMTVSTGGGAAVKQSILKEIGSDGAAGEGAVSAGTEPAAPGTAPPMAPGPGPGQDDGKAAPGAPVRMRKTPAGAGPSPDAGAQGVKQAAPEGRSDPVSPSGMDISGGKPGMMPPDIRIPEEPRDGKPVEVPLIPAIPARKVSPGFFTAWKLSAAEGVLFTDEDIAGNRPVLVLGASLAKRLFSDGNAIGKRARFNGTVHTVIGVLKPVPVSGPGRSLDDTAFTTPLSFPVRLADGSVVMQFSQNQLSFMPKSPERADSAVRELTAFMQTRYGEGAVTVLTGKSGLEERRTMQVRILVVTGILTLLCLFVSALNALSLSYLKTGRMERSLGIVRACGAKRTNVFAVFLYEAALLAAAGAVPGLALGFFLSRSIGPFIVPEGWAGVSAAMAFWGAAACIPAVLVPVLSVLIPVTGSGIGRKTGFMVRD